MERLNVILNLVPFSALASFEASKQTERCETGLFNEAQPQKTE